MIGRALSDEGLLGEGHLLDRVEPRGAELFDLDMAPGPVRAAGAGQGDVLIVEPGLQGWVEVPPFTGELKYAKSLLPDGLYTISPDPRIVCAAALRALALTDAPPMPYLSLRSELRA
jgi:hypothetical protein